MNRHCCIQQILAALFIFTLTAPQATASDWPKLPEKDAAVLIPAQEWPLQPRPRTVKVSVYYPGGSLEKVNAGTGLMLTLHNWGGSDCVGTARPRDLADRLNVIALCVDYLQSGKKASIDDPEAYDFGYLQALDALGSLYFVHGGLKSLDRQFADGRIYATGGSGGGNVSLMVNKLAPRTFACIIDLCGMAKLSDDIAFNLAGGSDLDARFSRDPKSPNFLTLDGQELRFIGNPEHLQTMHALGSSSKILVVHGTDDKTCPFEDAQELANNLRRAELDVEPHWISAKELDGKVFTSSGHSLGDRTAIVFQVAGKYLLPGGEQALVRRGPTDFERRDAPVRYQTSNGAFVISYEAGYPVGRFEPEQEPIAYSEHQNLLYYRDRAEARHEIKTPADWEIRREHILRNMQLAMGKFPTPLQRVPLDVKVLDEVRVGKLIRRKLTYQSDRDDRVSAYLLLPAVSETGKLPAILSLQQTNAAGKDEAAGISGSPNLQYGLQLAERGYVVLIPDYPSFGEHTYDFDPKHGYQSGTMKAIWDNVRALDYLQSLEMVDPERIGCIGHSLGGHNALFTAAFEPRIKALVSSCGFTRFHKDDVPSWTGPRYMPLIAKNFANDPDRVPFDFTEIVAACAPRAVMASAAVRDSDFDVSGVRDTIEAAKPIFALFGVPERLEAYYPDTGHDFPADAREKAFNFLDRNLRKAEK